MLRQFSNSFNILRGMPIMSTLLALLLSSPMAFAGSIPSPQKTTSSQQQQQQQQQLVAQNQQQQQQPHLPQHQSHLQHQEQQQQQQPQQQQIPALHQALNQQNINSYMQAQEKHELGLLSPTNLPSEQSSQDYIKENVDIDEEINDPYQYLSDLKMEPRLTAGNSLLWTNPQRIYEPPAHIPTMFSNFPYASTTPYGTFGSRTLPSMVTPRLIPFFSYPQAVFLPFPMYLAASTDIFYPGFTGTGNAIDDSLPRAIGDHRRMQSSNFHSTHTTSGIGTPPTSARNSQMYFMRLAPMPYMFMPGGLGFTASQANLPHLDPYNQLSAAISPILNIPLNFMSNGKPTNIYQISGAPNDFANSMQFNNVNPFGFRPPASFSPGFSFAATQKPTPSNVGGSSFSAHGSYGLTTPTHSHSQQQDSKMTLLKRPFLFNGRPDEIYTLPNNFNSLYSDSAYY